MSGTAYLRNNFYVHFYYQYIVDYNMFNIPYICYKLKRLQYYFQHRTVCFIGWIKFMPWPSQFDASRVLNIIFPHKNLIERYTMKVCQFWSEENYQLRVGDFFLFNSIHRVATFYAKNAYRKAGSWLLRN